MRVPIRLLHVFSKKKKEYYARKLVGFSTKQMFDVVSDVKNYEYFVPFCTKSTVIEKTPTGLKANLEVGFLSIYESYISNVTCVKEKSCKAICRDGRLFTTLENHWRFSPGLKNNPQTCIVDFHINFEFKSVIYTQVASLFFDQLVAQMEDAFINEARRRYGPESLPVHKLEVVKTEG